MPLLIIPDNASACANCFSNEITFVRNCKRSVAAAICSGVCAIVGASVGGFIVPKFFKLVNPNCFSRLSISGLALNVSTALLKPKIAFFTKPTLSPAFLASLVIPVCSTFISLYNSRSLLKRMFF